MNRAPSVVSVSVLVLSSLAAGCYVRTYPAVGAGGVLAAPPPPPQPVYGAPPPAAPPPVYAEAPPPRARAGRRGDVLPDDAAAGSDPRVSAACARLRLLLGRRLLGLDRIRLELEQRLLEPSARRIRVHRAALRLGRRPHGLLPQLLAGPERLSRLRVRRRRGARPGGARARSTSRATWRAEPAHTTAWRNAPGAPAGGWRGAPPPVRREEVRREERREAEHAPGRAPRSRAPRSGASRTDAVRGGPGATPVRRPRAAPVRQPAGGRPGMGGPPPPECRLGSLPASSRARWAARMPPGQAARHGGQPAECRPASRCTRRVARLPASRCTRPAVCLPASRCTRAAVRPPGQPTRAVECLRASRCTRRRSAAWAADASDGWSASRPADAPGGRPARPAALGPARRRRRTPAPPPAIARQRQQEEVARLRSRTPGLLSRLRPDGRPCELAQA